MMGRTETLATIQCFDSAIFAKHSNIYGNVFNNPSGLKMGYIYTGPHLPTQTLYPDRLHSPGRSRQ